MEYRNEPGEFENASEDSVVATADNIDAETAVDEADQGVESDPAISEGSAFGAIESDATTDESAEQNEHDFSSLEQIVPAS